MSVQIPESATDLLESPLVCTVTTVMPNGQPQVTAVWFDFDGANIRINTAEGRQKARNLKLNSKVTVFILDPQNAYHFVEWRGHVAEIKSEEEGGRDHINALSLRYRGTPVYKGQVENERRIMYVIDPDKIRAQ
ncbi:MAG: PPOX class F420-dependent oxidoreductase [Chloroflexota bacterium]